MPRAERREKGAQTRGPFGVHGQRHRARVRRPARVADGAGEQRAQEGPRRQPAHRRPREAQFLDLLATGSPAAGGGRHWTPQCPTQGTAFARSNSAARVGEIRVGCLMLLPDVNAVPSRNSQSWGCFRAFVVGVRFSVNNNLFRRMCEMYRCDGVYGRLDVPTGAVQRVR